MDIEINKDKVSNQISDNNDEEYRKQTKFNYDLKHKLSKVPGVVLNRRYKKLQQLIDEDDYFSEDSIRMRDPILYYMYVGKYKRHGDELPEKNIALSTLLIKQAQNDDYKKKLCDEMKKTKYILHFDPNEKEEINAEELLENEDELIRIMHDKFLCGLDKQYIDYEAIDDNIEYDDNKIIDQDFEDKYFDEEEDNNIPDAKYSGEQDY